MIWSNPKKTREMKPWSVKNGTYRERFNFPTFLHETELLLRGDHPNIDSHWPKPSPKPRLETNDLERWNFHSDRYAGMPGQSGATQKSTDWEVRVICRHHLLWPFVYNGSWVNTQFSSFNKCKWFLLTCLETVWNAFGFYPTMAPCPIQRWPSLITLATRRSRTTPVAEAENSFSTWV